MATNNINGKIYVGQTKDFIKRKREHKNAIDDGIFHKAIRKYGFDNFSWNIICECPEQDVDIQEMYWIKYYQSNMMNKNYINTKGYNMTDGGHGMRGNIASDETRKKMSISTSRTQIGRKLSDETKLKLSIAHKNKIISDTAKNNMKLANQKSAILRRDQKIYTLINKDGRIEKEITRYEFRRKYNLPKGVDHIFNGQKQSYKGWRINKNTYTK